MNGMCTLMPSRKNRLEATYYYFGLFLMLFNTKIIGAMKTQAHLHCKSYKFPQSTTLQSLYNPSIDTVAFQSPQHLLNPHLIQIQIADSTKSPSPLLPAQNTLTSTQ
jgi:hypothetical protein